MRGMFSQVWTVVVMNILSLPRRLWMSLAAVLAVGVSSLRRYWRFWPWPKASNKRWPEPVPTALPS